MIPVVFAITTDASGDYTSTNTDVPKEPVKLFAVEWVDGSLADGVDFVLSCVSRVSGVERVLLDVDNADNDAWYFPRVDAHGGTGTELAEGADKTATRTKQVVSGALKLVVANGGDTKTGTLVAYLDCG